MSQDGDDSRRVEGETRVAEGWRRQIRRLVLGERPAGRSDLDLRAGEPIAVVTGTATLPNSARAANAGTVRSVAFVLSDNVAYAVAAPTGTTILFR